MRTVFVEHENRVPRPGEDGSRRDDELERWFLIGEKAREEETGHSPDDIPGRDRSQVVYLAQ